MYKGITILIENYVHEDSYAMSSSHFGKKQSSLLIAVLFYRDEDNILKKFYYDFVSEYLGHNSVFYEKCMSILYEEIKQTMEFEITAIYNVTDGGSHFVSRFAFWSVGKFAKHYGTFICDKITNLEIKIHQITCPPQHGKGECDGHGAVVKRKARLFLLIGKLFKKFY